MKLKIKTDEIEFEFFKEITLGRTYKEQNETIMRLIKEIIWDCCNKTKEIIETRKNENID